jgi:hypothetical protein
VDDVLVRLGVTLAVVDVPAEALEAEEGVDELAARLRFVVLAGAVGIGIAVESLDQIDDEAWGGHRSLSRASWRFSHR